VRARLRELALRLLDVTAYEPCIARARAGEPAEEAAEWTYLLARMKKTQVRVAKAVLYALDNPNAPERYRGGRVPYGRQVHDGHLADDPAEQAVIDRIVRFRRAGRSRGRLPRPCGQMASRSRGRRFNGCSQGQASGGGPKLVGRLRPRSFVRRSSAACS
jgi:hypothetical protein